LAITQAIGGEYANTADTEGDFDTMPASMKILVSVFLFVILGWFTLIGLKITGSAAWFWYFFLIPFYAVFPMALYGASVGLSILIAYLIGWPVLRAMFKRRGWVTIQSTSTTGTTGGWFSGGGWSFGGGWSSGGGFSGGGGSFGGGGSSGGW
jgi:uncharacterized protein